MTERTHRCAAEGCDEQVPRSMLMCRGHWFKVPKPLRDEIWRTYRHCGVLSHEYQEAVASARSALAASPSEPMQEGGRFINPETVAAIRADVSAEFASPSEPE